MKSLYFIVILFLYLSSNTVAKESRIFLEGYINGKPVKLILDTGATGPTLFRPAVKRLKLSIERPPANVKVEKGLVRYALTEKCKFQMVEGGTESILNFAVVDVPDFLTSDIDGVMGWGGFGHMMIELNSNLRKVKIRNKLEFNKSEWKCLDIKKDINVLVVNTSSKDKTRDCFLIDTGSPDGLTVGQELWDKLVGGEITNKTTLSASYMPGVGLTVNKENWLEKIDLGGLQLRDIPVKKGMDSLKAYTDLGVDGILGMWALSGYSWILDGENGKVYYKKNELVRIP
jgi:predicted aspartyl protease